MHSFCYNSIVAGDCLEEMKKIRLSLPFFPGKGKKLQIPGALSA